MKNLDFYKWIAGSANDFTKRFSENEVLYNRARGFWHQLEGDGLIIIALFVVLGILFAWCYYGPYNEKPGRHFKPKNWLVFMLITFVASFVATLVFEYIVAAPKLDGALMLEVKIALGNAVYATLVYLLTSVVWCNWLPTNAYRLLKF
jgi:hypothetical protein